MNPKKNGGLPVDPELPPQQPVAAKLVETAPRYKARAPGEWDGMLVDLNETPPCLDGAYCGLARACVKAACAACESASVAKSAFWTIACCTKKQRAAVVVSAELMRCASFVLSCVAEKVSLA